MSSKDTVKRIKKKKQVIQTGRRYLQLFASDIGFLSRICEEISKLNNKKQTSQLKIFSNDLNRHTAKEDIQMVNKYMKSAQDHQTLGKCKVKLCLIEWKK